MNLFPGQIIEQIRKGWLLQKLMGFKQFRFEFVELSQLQIEFSPVPIYQFEVRSYSMCLVKVIKGLFVHVEPTFNKPPHKIGLSKIFFNLEHIVDNFECLIILFHFYQN